MNLTVEQIPQLPACKPGPGKPARDLVGDLVQRQNEYYDRICELIQRQEAFRRCDEYINQPDFDIELKNFWEAIKRREAENLLHLQALATGPGTGMLWLSPELTSTTPKITQLETTTSTNLCP